MSMHPIIAALRKHKASAALMAAQIALSLAIVCNATFIISQRVERISRPTGINESDLFLVTQQWVGAPSMDTPDGVDKLDTLLQEDLTALTRLADVASVADISTLPLLGSTRTWGLTLKPDQQQGIDTVYYFGDDKMLSTLGLRLLSGRGFDKSDIRHQGDRDSRPPSIVIVTKALADRLFPGGGAVGKIVYLEGSSKPITVVGVVERLQTSASDNWTKGYDWNATLIPARLNTNFSRYAVRAKHGRLAAAMKAVPAALYAANPMRVLDDRSVRGFADIRAEAYRSDVGMAILMSIVCSILLVVTAACIVGLSSLWVGQRYKQIGVRRALGARKGDILRYFLAENLLITGGGAVNGGLLAVGLNLWLMSHYEMDRMPLRYVLIGIVTVLVLNQLAVFMPARRASDIPPVVAARMV